MSERITEAGVYDIPADVYHADPCPEPSLSSSGARKLVTTCPARYWYDRQNPPEPTEALDIGTAAHEWLLEGDTWPQRFAVLPDDHNGATKDGKALVAEIIASGRRPLKAEPFRHIKGMIEALKAHPFAWAAFQNGRAEQSLFWRDDDYGIWCRSRPDFRPTAGTIIVDYKTTRSANPDYLSRAMYDYGYHQQAEWYCWGEQVIGAIQSPSFAFVFQEKEPPYLVTVAVPDGTAMQWAAIQNRAARGLFAKCLRTGKWPGYADDVVTVGIPGYADKQLQQKHDAGLFAKMMAWQAPQQEAAE